MEKIICLDTSILIDYYRKRDKSKSAFFQLTQKYHLFAVSIITEYEILVGSNPEQELFWRDFFDRVTILPFNNMVNKAAVVITKQLKSENKMIEIPDLFIGATSIANHISIATLNLKHFRRIKDLEIVEL